LRDETDISAALLAWYDRSARVMPWRISPQDRAEGVRPDPYAVWLSEVMLQQTTVAAVREYFRRFTARWPTVEALAAAEDAEVMAEWAGLGYYARARNLLKCAREVAARGGFPQTAAGLQTLPGIGPYTSAAIASIAFDEPAPVVDGNVERVVARLFEITTELPEAKPEIFAATARITPAKRPGDFAQAMMDLGATICTPRKPVCALCPLSHTCSARQSGIAETLPRKKPKAAKPECVGLIWIAQQDGATLIETRPAKGLLGGTIGFPTTDWRSAPQDLPPVEAKWRVAPTQVRHTFTHFHLTLTVHVAQTQNLPNRGRFERNFDPTHLPTLMRKAWDAAQPLL
jgi:A/G-specific adenine glycosylase